MKTAAYFLLSAILLTSCRDCADPTYYQIRTKTPVPESSWKCDFVAVGIGTCYSFQSPPQIVFSDSCKNYLLSQVLKKSDLVKYQNH